jgi:hypothetical protein
MVPPASTHASMISFEARATVSTAWASRRSKRI